MQSVIVERLSRKIPTYRLEDPERHPVFFEKRVFQGSSGKVYPLPFVDRVKNEDSPQPVEYDVVRMENDYIRLEMLPEIGGRIFLGQDKCNDDYDFFYRQDVIKPALVGLAGPWISGGVEFNWPQHHRPSTFMPCDVSIEEEADGARTVWFSEHDPLLRMKGMHGVRLRPDSACIELRVRLFNRTPITQTFLWWANVAARVHDQYQSFFPADVHYVADHAVRDMTGFPCSDSTYYGIDYRERPGSNDLRFYSNIPVPTSYMVCETDYGFFGGYDYSSNGGFVHVADPAISPGKKQWTWGNSEFGWAWDRELTDENGPYVELMAGVYTDNQPDFSYLLPLETKTFSQYWWPFQKTGPLQNANENLGLRLHVGEDGRLDLGAVAASPQKGLTLILDSSGGELLRKQVDIDPSKPWQGTLDNWDENRVSELHFRIESPDGHVLLDYRPPETGERERTREKATEPPFPEEMNSSDECFLTGEHLELYRHPTRDPEPYWLRGIELDPGDFRCHLAMGKRALANGALKTALIHLEKAIERLTHRHPNPSTGEAHYYLGLANRCSGSNAAAHKAFSKAHWNYEWRSAAHYELACLEAKAGKYASALDHVEKSLVTNTDCNKAHVLRALLLQSLGKEEAAREALEDLLAMDPLDHWALHVFSELNWDWTAFLDRSRNDAQTVLDIAFDYIHAGFQEAALRLLKFHHENSIQEAPVPNPLRRCLSTHYLQAWILEQMGQPSARAQYLAKISREGKPDYFFPSRLDEENLLRWAMKQNPEDALAGYGLGNLLYDKRRYDEAFEAWQASLSCKELPGNCRNLGLAYWNVERNGELAEKMYRRAIALDPQDARLIYEYDQLRRKLNHDPAERLQGLLENRELVLQRDDAAVELASLYNRCGEPVEAYKLLKNRRFHPWEGGEGKVLSQYSTACLLLGKEALGNRDSDKALEYFKMAVETPDNLGEKYHPLQAKADIYYWIGKAYQSMGDDPSASDWFRKSSSETSDFRDMAVSGFTELSFFCGLSLRELGEENRASGLFQAIFDYASAKEKEEPHIDYFATSLPRLLVFEEDIETVHSTEVAILKAYASLGLGNQEAARKYFEEARGNSVSDIRLIHLQDSLAVDLAHL